MDQINVRAQKLIHMQGTEGPQDSWDWWHQESGASSEAPIVIGGCVGSGVALLRCVLNSHPQICLGPRTELFLPSEGPWCARKYNADMLRAWFIHKSAIGEALLSNSQALFAEWYLKTRAVTCDKPLWGEATPHNVFVLPWIWKHWPHAKFVHVVRDGRDTLCNLRTAPKWELQPSLTLLARTNKHKWESCVQTWLAAVDSGLAFRDHPNYIEVKYEDLVRAPQHTLSLLCLKLGVSWSTNVLAHQEVNHCADLDCCPEANNTLTWSRVGRWRTDLDKTTIERLRKAGGDRMKSLGYVTDDYTTCRNW